MHDPRSTPPDSGVRRPEAGDRLGRYRVLARLGAGAVGEVYRVEDEFGRQLALKLFTGAAEEERLARFAREGEVTATLRHSGIVGVHGAGVAGTSPYLVYELVEGEDLECAWRRLSRERLLQVVLEVADALGYAHARGVVHRDLKPANVLLDRGGRARVADFGLAQVAGLERLTRSGAAVGTPHYMSPEQATGARERYGPHSDVWALGVVLYRALCGRLPFDAQTLLELMVQIGTASPPPPGTLDPTVSPALEAVCLHALAREPEDRYPHAAAFAADLRRALAGESVALPAARPRGRAPALGAALAAAVALAGLAGWLLRSGDAPSTPERRALDSPAGSDSKVAQERERKAWDAITGALDANDPTEARRLLVEGLERDAGDPRGLRAQLVSAGAKGPQRLEPVLRTLAASSAELPPSPHDPGERALADLGFARVEARFREAFSRSATPGTHDTALAQETRACVELLELMGRAGLRPGDTRVAPFCELLRNAVQITVLDEGPYWSTLRALVRLDLPVHSQLYMLQLGAREPEPRPWGDPPWGFWERYLEDRIRWHGPERPRARARLELLLETPPGEADALGPVQWAQTAVLLSTGEDSLPRVERALALAPQLPEAHAWFAHVAQLRGDVEGVLAHSTRALERFTAANCADLTHQIGVRNDLEGLRIWALASLGRRDEARELWEVLITRGSGTAGALRAEFPWLGD